MIRTLITISLLVTVPIHNLFAQKIDLDKRKFKTEYAQLPTDRTLSYFDTYSVDFFTNQSILDAVGLFPTTINALFDLEGYVYTKEEAQFNYSITIEKPILIVERIENIEQTIKNPDGTRKKVITYVAIASYAIPTTICIKLIPYGTVLYSATFSTSSNPTVYKSAPQTNLPSALSILNAQTKGINTYVTNTYRDALKAEVQKMKNVFCFQTCISSNFLWEVDEKSNPNFSVFNSEVNKCVDLLEKLDKNTPVTDARIQMASSIAYWSSILTDTKPTTKNLLKLRYACLYNVAVCQYYLELYDDCIATCDLLIANKHNRSDGTNLKHQVKLAQESILKSGLTSRHQERLGFVSKERFEYIRAPKNRY